MTEEDDPYQILPERTYEELYEEIMAQIEAIEARSRLMQWPITSVASGAVSVSVVPVRKPKPVRPKVRYRAHWRKEQIERKLRTEGDTAWEDLKEHPELIIHTTDDWSIVALSGGMNSGRPSVAIRINLPDGTVVVAETSMRLFLGAARVFAGRYGPELA